MAGRTDIEPAPLAPPPVRPATLGSSAVSLQASARRLDPTVTKGANALDPENRAHTEAWANYEIPEVQKLVTGAAGLLSQCRLYVGFVDDRGMEQPLRDEDGKPAEGFEERFVADCEATLARFVDRNGSQRGLLQTTAECWDVTGETYMVGWPTNEDGDPAEDPSTAVGERWEALSRSAIAKGGGRWIVQLEPSKLTKLPELAVAYRMWRSHPRFPDATRSWLMSAVEPCRDLRVFTAAQRAAARSGIVADLLIVPSEASPRQAPTLPPMMPGTPIPAGVLDAKGQRLMGDANALATFVERIIGDAVLEVLRDTQAGRTVIPPVIAMAQDYIEKIRKISLARPVDQGLLALVEQARHRIADAADAESEFLFGLGDTNRWNGAQIDDTDYRRSFRPKALAIADAWTMELLWGGLRGLQWRPEQYRRVRVLVDPRGVVAEPDLAKAATEGLQLGAIGWPAWREANGFDETAAPTPEELTLILEHFGRRRGATGEGSRGGQQEGPDEATEVNEDVAAAPGEPEPTPRPTPGRRASMAQLAAQAATPEQDVMAELLVVEQAARARLEEASESALDAALHRAGSKLRNAARRAASSSGRTDLIARLAGAESRDVHTILGPELAAQLTEGQYATEEARRNDLFAAALAALLGSFERITDDAYRRAAVILGVEFPEGELAANRAAGAAVLAGSMALWADRTVFDPIKGAVVGETTGLRVPMPVLRRAAAAAGGAPVGVGVEATVEAAGGIAFGPTVMTAAAQAAAARGEELSRIGFTWVYGSEPRMSPWHPHQELDGRRLTGPSDPQLAGKAPGGGQAFPGDHGGCRCDWVPTVTTS